MDYDLYHDESQEKGYWHGMLLVPQITRNVFLKFLEEIRKETNYPYQIFFKGLSNKGKRFNCISSWIQLGVGSLMQYFKNEPYIINVKRGKKYLGEQKLFTDYKELIKIDSDNKIIGAKFILFKERNSHSKMNRYPDHASKIETTFRMGALGGIHWLGKETDPINIKSIHFDGHEHYHRKIDEERIIGRIKSLRDYCSFDEKFSIYDKSSNHTKNNSQDYNDCQLLQLTDLLVGSFRTILGDDKNNIQKEVSFPVEEIISKWEKGFARMKRSRWFGGFYMSECWLESDGWKFGNFRYKNTKQEKLI